jgi:2-hydroxychromene-2-carboxylate isomerase
LQRFTAAVFDAYFADGRNIDDPEVLVSVANSIGLDGSAVVGQTGDQAIKDRLRGNTDEAISRGAFGSPSMFVNEQLYFGNDQLPLVAQALRTGSAS